MGSVQLNEVNSVNEKEFEEVYVEGLIDEINFGSALDLGLSIKETPNSVSVLTFEVIKF